MYKISLRIQKAKKKSENHLTSVEVMKCLVFWDTF